MSKKALIVINPNSGLKKANRFLTDILSLFNAGNYECTVQTTTREHNGTKCVLELGNNKDLVVCIGGDGTFNEVLAGVMQLGTDIPIGYIPSGSTNDFASSLGISKNILTAAKEIVNGEPVSIDAGSFNERIFSYVASCGAFTDTSYTTPTDLKNSLGHTAYVLEGIKSIPNIKPIHLKVQTDKETFEDDYIMAAICNATSIGGILKFDKKYIDFSDGLLEVLLIKAPNDPAELTKTLHFINTRNYNNDCIRLVSTSFAKIESDKKIDWSLDGELQTSDGICEIKNISHAFKIILQKNG